MQYLYATPQTRGTCIMITSGTDISTDQQQSNNEMKIIIIIKNMLNELQIDLGIITGGVRMWYPWSVAHGKQIFVGHEDRTERVRYSIFVRLLSEFVFFCTFTIQLIGNEMCSDRILAFSKCLNMRFMLRIAVFVKFLTHYLVMKLRFRDEQIF